MGTPGGEWTLQPGHCVHKLPTSCLLTSTQKCCACEDERAHTPTYSRYIDGMGMTNYGTRWQSYCWPCKSFWDNRIEKSGIPNRETRIPNYPEQHRFLLYWYSFYLGSNLLDGPTLISGEAWKDVDVGSLPRTTFEIIHQSPVSQFELEIVHLARAAAQARATQVPIISVQDTLDQLLEEADEEELIQSLVDDDSWYLAAEDPVATQTTLIDTSDTHLIDTLNHITNRFDFSASSPNQLAGGPTEDTSTLLPDSSPFEFTASPQAITGRSTATRERVRARQPRFTRFEPRWGIDEAPIRDMLMMASGRSPVLVESPNEEPTVPLQTGLLRIVTEDSAPDLEAENDAEQGNETQSIGTQATTFDELAEEVFRRARRRRGFVPRRQEELLARFEEDHGDYSGSLAHGGRRFLGLDDPARPSVPATEEEKIVKMECSICYDQKATIALFPCGHAVMCEWYITHDLKGLGANFNRCADAEIPVGTSSSTKTVPIRTSYCPICRIRVRQRVKLFI
jgi:hypothetical protein